MKKRKLSILIPIYNEKDTISKVIDKLSSLDIEGWEKELIVVDDCSTDTSRAILEKLQKKVGFVLLKHKKNLGKGVAIRTAIAQATGSVCVVQDGDLEYDPTDFIKMLKQLDKSGCQIVYGSRRLNRDNIQYSGLSYYIGGLLLTHLTNLLYGSNITDEPTCYKMFDTNLLRSLNIQANGFEFCPEVTAKALKRGHQILEVPISYIPRSVAEGKKINASDFLTAVVTLIKYRI